MSFVTILFSFKGRINRAKFWMYHWVYPMLIGCAALIVVTAVYLVGAIPLYLAGAIQSITWERPAELMMPFGGVFTVWVQLAAIAKRWHDRDKSAWWTLIGVIPIVGPIWVMVEVGFLKGTEGPNRFGPDPLKNQ